MSGRESHTIAGRFAALATLGVSIALFFVALSGISSIDPSASSAAPAGAPAPPVPARGVSLDRHVRDGRNGFKRRDCPWHRKDAARRGVSS